MVDYDAKDVTEEDIASRTWDELVGDYSKEAEEEVEEVASEEEYEEEPEEEYEEVKRHIAAAQGM
jgi:hypothetical protein